MAARRRGRRKALVMTMRVHSCVFGRWGPPRWRPSLINVRSVGDTCPTPIQHQLIPRLHGSGRAPAWSSLLLASKLQSGLCDFAINDPGCNLASRCRSEPAVSHFERGAVQAFQEIQLRRGLRQLVAEEVARGLVLAVVEIARPAVAGEQLLEPHPRDDDMPEGFEVDHAVGERGLDIR